MHKNVNSTQKKNVSHYVREKEEREVAGGDAKMASKLRHEESGVKFAKEEKKEDENSTSIKVKDAESDDESIEKLKEDNVEDSHDSLSTSTEETHNAEIEKSQVRTEYLQYQNKVNVQRLCEILEVERDLRKNINEKDKRIKRVEKENEELMKEIKVKNKFVFKM